MSDKTIEQYLNRDMENYPIIPNDEFIERYKLERQNPDLEEQEKLILPHMRLNRKIAKELYRKYHPSGLTVDDLISEGFFGLKRAYEKFDIEKGVKFSSYASIWIKQTIQNLIDNHGEVVRIPVNQIQKIKRVEYHTTKYLHENGRNPTDEELEKITGYSTEEIQTIRLNRQVHNQISLEDKIFEDGDSMLKDNVIDTRDYSASTGDQDTFNSILGSSKSITEREKQVLTLRYVVDMSLQEIATNLNLTKERIRQIESKALRKLRHSAKQFV